MKIATFNANGIRARLSNVLRWLETECPEILCIQETKVQDKDFPRDPFEKLGYYCTFRGQKAYNGVAVLTRVEPQLVTFGFEDGDVREEPRLIRVHVSDVQVVNTYVPQGYAPDTEKFQYKLSWLQRLKAFFETTFDQDAPLLWVGDFNVAPAAIDVYDPKRLAGKVGFHPAEQEALASIRAWGFVDVFRKHEPGEKKFSFWDYRIPKAVERGLGWRIDHVWALPQLARKSTRSWIDEAPRRWEKPSDHTFVVAEFDLDQKESPSLT